MGYEVIRMGDTRTARYIEELLVRDEYLLPEILPHPFVGLDQVGKCFRRILL